MHSYFASSPRNFKVARTHRFKGLLKIRKTVEYTVFIGKTDKIREAYPTADITV